MSIQDKLNQVNSHLSALSELRSQLFEECLHVYPFHSEGVEYLITTTYSQEANEIVFTLVSTMFKQIPLDSASIKLLSDFSAKAIEIKNQIPELGFPISSAIHREKMLKLFNVTV